MIRVFSGGRYSLEKWQGLAYVLRLGLSEVCENDCSKCQYDFVCKEVSQAITYCDVMSNNHLASKQERRYINHG